MVSLTTFALFAIGIHDTRAISISAQTGEQEMPRTKKNFKLKNEPLIKETSDILLPPLHIKLGIASKFIKTAVKSSAEVFDCLKTIFPKLSDAKIKAGNHVILIIFISDLADPALSISI